MRLHLHRLRTAATRASASYLPQTTASSLKYTFLMFATTTGSVLSPNFMRADAPAKFVTGAFLQFDEGNVANSAVQWQAELAAMRVIGMDVVVVQYLASDDRYFYPTSESGVETTRSDAVRTLLRAAEDQGIRVFLGLHMNNAFWEGKVDLDERLDRNLKMLKELHARYCKSKALAGWYLPEEIDDHTAGKPHAAALLEYFGRISNFAHQRTALPVMISPYFGQRPDATAYARWWDKVALPQIHVDVVALQDGVGTHRTSIEESRQVFAALAPVMKRHRVAFWANNECFDQTSGWPVSEGNWTAQSTDAKTFRKQVDATAPFVEKAVTFEFHHYMNPAGPHRAQELYREYRKMLRRQAKPAVSSTSKFEANGNSE